MSWILLPLMIIFVGSGVFLILMVLVQASRGTGLAGLMGGGSDRSAFGTKTGSMMSKVTVALAILFMVSALAYSVAGKKSAPGEEQKNPPATSKDQDAGQS